MSVGHDVEAGYAALARGEWARARSDFERALATVRTPAAYEGLGIAAWWLEDVRATFDARGRAFHGYQAENDRLGAARVATAVAWDHLLAGEQAISQGWLQRARRLVADLGPCPESGWLAIFDAHQALMVTHDAAAAERASVAAMSLGRDLGEVDLEMVGMAYRGLAVVGQGRVDDGMRLLDEATAAALAGEIQDPDAAASCCCALIYACERVYDYARAAEWCIRLRELSAGWSYRLMLSVCRTHYAGVLLWRGAWAEAEAELLTALRAMEVARPGEAAEAVVRLAELRCHQGRFDEASALLTRTESDPLRAQGHILGLRGRAELALHRGSGRIAADLAERYLRALGARNRIQRAGGLELLAIARSSTGELASARAAAAELAAIADEVATVPIRGSAMLAAGTVASAAGEHEQARRLFEDAVDHFQHGGGVFEAARARLRLADTLSALDRPTDATVEAQAAYRVFHQLGAHQAAADTAALLRGLAGAVADSIDAGAAHLTSREVEILRLLAKGLSNQVIAHELFLSIRTVERHIGNIYGKLGVTGSAARAGATAFALTHGIH